MVVVKFGGTSVGDANAIRRAAAITRSRADRGPIVVVSALGGCTNVLLEIAEQAARGQLIGAIRGVESVRERHLSESARLLGEGEAADNVRGELSAMIDDIASLAEALSVLGHLTPRSLDAIASIGELLSSTLIAAAFQTLGLPAELIDARRVIVTDEQYTRAAPDVDALTRASRDTLLPLVNAGRIPVLGGFIGATSRGVTTTLGRGGSDFSASLIGAALGAEAIEIWTDVAGMMTADPRVVPSARVIAHIRFEEAAELASFGAKVLHPSTITPAVRQGIPVHIYDSRNPAGRGTRITADGPPRAVTAVAGKGGVTVIRVRSSRMLHAHGFLRALFEVFERHRTSVDVVATSEVSVSVTVDDPSRLDELLVDLTPMGDVSLERNRAIVALVGSALGAHGDAMGRALSALADIPIHMLSLSASGINLTVIIDGDRLASAMRSLHATFFAEEEAA